MPYAKSTLAFSIISALEKTIVPLMSENITTNILVIFNSKLFKQEFCHIFHPPNSDQTSFIKLCKIFNFTLPMVMSFHPNFLVNFSIIDFFRSIFPIFLGPKNLVFG